MFGFSVLNIAAAFAIISVARGASVSSRGISVSVNVSTTTRPVKCLGAHVATNPQCCVWYQARDQLLNVFGNQCNDPARTTIRLAFHDAAGFSVNSASKGGGADGSIITFGSQELNYASNAGLAQIVGELQPIADSLGVSYGDIIQVGAAVAVSVCPGGSRIQTFVGRPKATMPAPDGTLPHPFDNMKQILARMADIGFTPDELVALLVSHSVADQDHVDPSVSGQVFDSTAHSIDAQFFLETLLKGTHFPGNASSPGEAQTPLDGEFRLQSDALVARSPITACTWQSFVSDQGLMSAKFGLAMTKLSLVGQNRALLTDCTEIIGNPPPATAPQAYFPAGKQLSDIEQSCSGTPFPTTLSTQAGAPTPIPTE